MPVKAYFWGYAVHILTATLRLGLVFRAAASAMDNTKEEFKNNDEQNGDHI
jgi:hypothetical protein